MHACARPPAGVRDGRGKRDGEERRGEESDRTGRRGGRESVDGSGALCVCGCVWVCVRVCVRACVYGSAHEILVKGTRQRCGRVRGQEGVTKDLYLYFTGGSYIFRR